MAITVVTCDYMKPSRTLNSSYFITCHISNGSLHSAFVLHIVLKTLKKNKTDLISKAPFDRNSDQLWSISFIMTDYSRNNKASYRTTLTGVLNQISKKEAVRSCNSKEFSPPFNINHIYIVCFVSS